MGGRGRGCINQSDFSGGDSEAPPEKEAPHMTPLSPPSSNPTAPEAGGVRGLRGYGGKGVGGAGGRFLFLLCFKIDELAD